LQQFWQAYRGRNMQEAISASNRLTGGFPDFAPGWHASSHIAQMLHQPHKALLAIDRALKLESGRADWHLHRVACLLKCGELSTARKTLGRFASDTDNRGLKSPEQLSRLAYLCNQAAMHDEAAALYARLVRLEPGSGEHWYNLATVQRFKGETLAAEASLDTAIQLNGSDYEAYELRSGLRKQNGASNHVKQLESLLAKGIASPAGEVRICYALAKELEDLGQSGRSFEVLQHGATLRRKHIKYRIEDDLRTIEAIRSTHDPEFFAREVRGHSSDEPIFVIGLPRTGTTLLEQMLGSHSEVTAAGELDNFAQQMMQQLRELCGKQDLTREERVERTTELDLERLGKAYLDSTRPLTGQTPRFIDKMPLNFLYAGLIHRALPGARIIQLTRHPMDTCYAIYKRLFQDAYPWSYDLHEIAKYFVAFHRLMAHWKRVMPGVIHEVAYESLVTDFEQQSRRLLEFCQLPWQQRCLSFHENTTPSTTASASQVRRPVYDSSVGIWRRYEKQLAPLAEVLRKQGIDID
jgi:hypothetical protein